jgi:membrane protease YdiL (CAAX protease family)
VNEPPSATTNSPLEPGATAPDVVPIQPWRWWIHLLLIAAYPLLIGVLGLGDTEARGPALTSGSKGLLLVCAVQLVIFGVVFGLAWVASRASRDNLLFRWRGGFWPVPLGIGYSVGLRLAVGLVAVAVGVALILSGVVSMAGLEKFTLANRPDVEAIVDVSAMRHNPLYFWLTLTLVSFVVAGLREELWRAAFLAGMRGLWPRRFGSRKGQLVAAGVAAVIFGLGHLPQGVLAVGMTGLLGFGLGLIMVLHRSIWPAVIAHGMFDATSLALIPWALEKLQEVQKTLGH